MTNGSTDPSLRIPLTPEGLIDSSHEFTVITPENITFFNDTFGEISELEELKKIKNPYREKGPNQIDLSSLSDEAISALEIVDRSGRGFKPGFRLPIADFGRVGWIFNKNTITIGKQAEAAYYEAKVFIDDHLDGIREKSSNFETADLEEINSLIDGMNAQAAEIPSTGSVSMLRTLQNALSIDTASWHKAVHRAARKLPGQKPFVSAFDILRGGEKRLLGQGERRLEAIEHNSKLNRDTGEDIFKDIMTIIRAQQGSRAVGIIETVIDMRDRLVQVAREGSIDLNKLAEEEAYLSRVAEQAERIMLSSLPELKSDPEAQKFLSDAKRLPIAWAIERQTADKAENLSKQLTEANDIMLGGRRLKPNKKLRNPEELSDKLAKLMNGAGENYRPELGIITAILSGRFDSFMQTIVRTSAENDALLEHLKQTRENLIRTLSDVDLQFHLENLEVILELHKDSLVELIGEDALANLNQIVKDRTGRDEIQADPLAYAEEGPEIDDSAVYGDEKVLANFMKNELIGVLDWTVLPITEGEEKLEEAAREIVEQAQARAERGVKVEIDLNRLNILKKLREDWGKDRCEYFRGKLRNKGHEDNSDRPDEYIVLVMRELDGQGNIVMEHAVAESPLAGENALYVLRGDTAAGSWRETFSLPKPYARDLGARRLLHSRGDGRPMVDLLTERVTTLLTCSPEEYFAIRFNGAGFWLRKLGGIAAAQNE